MLCLPGLWRMRSARPKGRPPCPDLGSSFSPSRRVAWGWRTPRSSRSPDSARRSHSQHSLSWFSPLYPPPLTPSRTESPLSRQVHVECDVVFTQNQPITVPSFTHGPKFMRTQPEPVGCGWGGWQGYFYERISQCLPHSTCHGISPSLARWCFSSGY